MKTSAASSSIQKSKISKQVLRKKILKALSDIDNDNEHDNIMNLITESSSSENGDELYPRGITQAYVVDYGD